MKTGKEFNTILDECLERLLAKDETIEQCLLRYPEQAAELKPLLQTALATKGALDIQPSAEFKARARYQFHSALVEAKARKSRPVFGWFPRWATALTLALGLLLAGGGTVAAAGYSMPDSPLYPVKLATEQVQLKLTPSTIGKAELNAELADRRVTEIVYAANKGDTQQIEAATQRLDERLVMLTELVSSLEADNAPRAMAPAPAAVPSEKAPAATPQEEAAAGKDVYAGASGQTKLKAKVTQCAANHSAALLYALQKAPEPAKPALRRAIAALEADYEHALKALD